MIMLIIFIFGIVIWLLLPENNTSFGVSFIPDELENRIQFATLEPSCFNQKVSDLLKVFGTKQILQSKLTRIGFPRNFPITDVTAPLIASELSKRNYSFSGYCIKQR